jgi:N-acetylglutamate synthase/N-acetylornithine aminotransferase
MVGLVTLLIPTTGQASEPSCSGFVVPEMAEILAAVWTDDLDLRKEKLEEILPAQLPIPTTESFSRPSVNTFGRSHPGSTSDRTSGSERKR